MWLAPELRAALRGADPFAQVMSWSGTPYREQAGRKTQRVECAGRRYFLKTHRGVGWKEILRDLARLRRPVVGAANEWRALRRLRQLRTT